MWLDAASLSPANLFTHLMASWGSWTLRAVVAFVTLFLIFGYFRAGEALLKIGRETPPTAVSRPLMVAHLCALGVFVALSPALFGKSPLGYATDAAALIWIVSGWAAITLAAIAFLSLRTWLRWVRVTGDVWAWALAAALLTCWVGNASRSLWVPASRLTFAIVKGILSFFLPRIVSDPASLTIGTPGFLVTVDPTCSGMEGVGLMLAFGVFWLTLFHRDFRFPRALLLLPASMAIAFLLNSVRIGALILLGTAGAPGVAAGGFHSQAGWIAFNALALSFAVGAQRLPWFGPPRKAPAPVAAPAENPTARYLAPFLAILAAAIVSRAASSQFEWLYPLRFFAAAAVLWHFRRRYSDLDWRFTWLGPAAGVLVFFIWIAADRLAGAPARSVASGFSGIHGWPWITWLVFRTMGAVVTVPVAEELAFRGFLLRRLVAADFERVDFRGAPFPAILVSSLIFGFMHGGRWVAGSLAGLLYALVVRRRDKFGEAVIAHAITNAILAAWVIWTGDWRFW